MTDKKTPFQWLLHYDRTVVFWFGVLLAIFGWYYKMEGTQKVSAENVVKLIDHETRIVKVETYIAVQNEVNKNLAEWLKEMKDKRK